MGLFYPFLDDKDVEIFGVEAAGKASQAGCTPPLSPVDSRDFAWQSYLFAAK